MITFIKNFHKTNLFFFAVLCIVIFALYGQSINYKITNLDDDYLIEQNVSYISNLKNIPDFFTQSCYYSKEFPYYRPVLSISFAIEAAVFGYNTTVSHFTNIIYFILSIFCIFLLASKLNLNQTVLKFITLIMAVHPILMSCPVWLPARNDTILIIFITLSLIYFLKFAETSLTKHLFICLFMFAASLFTKETSLLLIPIFPLVLYCFGYKFSKTQTFRIFIFLIPIFTIYFILRDNAVTTVKMSSYITNYSESAKVILTGFMTYLTKFFIPDYIPVMLYKINFSFKILATTIIFILFTLLMCRYGFIRKKILLFCSVWFVITLLPTLLIPDYLLLFHRFVIPSAGIIIFIADLGGNFLKKFPFTAKYFIVLFIILFSVFFSSSYIYSQRYKNPKTFWTNAYTDIPDYPEAMHGFAKVLIAEQKYEQAKHILYGALKYKYYNYLPTLAAVLIAEKKFDEAEELLLNALDRNTENYLKYQFYLNLGNVYMNKLNFTKAFEFTKISMELSPYNIKSFKQFAQIYSVKGDYEKAVEILLYLLKNDKTNTEYLSILTLLYDDLNDRNNALKFAAKTLSEDPENKTALDILSKYKN